MALITKKDVGRSVQFRGYNGDRLFEGKITGYRKGIFSVKYYIGHPFVGNDGDGCSVTYLDRQQAADRLTFIDTPRGVTGW